MITKQIEIGNIYASKQVWEMYNTNELQHLVDPMLYGNFSENETIRLPTLCTRKIQPPTLYVNGDRDDQR